MIKELDLGKYRKARVWLSELPDAGFDPGLSENIIVPARGQNRQAVSVGVEVYVPLGPRSMYGLLGGSFEPLLSEQLKVNVSSGKGGKNTASSLADSMDQVYAGLPKEYLEAVKEGVRLAQQKMPVASGELVINRAAYGEIGSCATVFRHLATVLIKLINVQKSDLLDGNILKLFPQNYS